MTDLPPWAAREQIGGGGMLQGFVPNAWFWRIRTEIETGWDAPATVTTLDAVGSFSSAPFTGAVAALGAPALNAWQQNTSGGGVFLSMPIAQVAFRGQNGHVYLETSADGATNIRRLDFFPLRNGGAVR